MSDQKKGGQGNNDIISQKKARQMPKGNTGKVSNPAETPKDADGTTSERKLRKITQGLCKTCKYRTYLGANYTGIACYYIVREGHSIRVSGECPPGYCDRHKTGRTEPDDWRMNLREGYD